MPYARSSDGIKLYYEEHGRTGTPLVLAYGIGGNTDMWDVNVAALAAAHRLMLWEPRGHARSDSPEDPARYSFARWALDLRDVLDHLRLRRAHVGGPQPGRGHRHAFHPALSRARPLTARHELVVGQRAAAVGGQHRHARAVDQGHARAGMDAMAEFAMRPTPTWSSACGIDPGARDGVLRGVPAAHADRLRQLAARAARHGPHHRPSCRRSACPSCSSAATATPRSSR